MHAPFGCKSLEETLVHVGSVASNRSQREDKKLLQCSQLRQHRSDHDHGVRIFVGLS